MDPHQQRIANELKAAGVTWYGRQKFSIKYLPKVIHKDEHIKGIVYGRYKEKNGPSLNEGILVATDLRIMFLDHKPGYTKNEEVAYDAVSGVKKTRALFYSITLHTKLGDYNLRFVNARCAVKFVDYVEKRRMRYTTGFTNSPASPTL